MENLRRKHEKINIYGVRKAISLMLISALELHSECSCKRVSCYRYSSCKKFVQKNTFLGHSRHTSSKYLIKKCLSVRGTSILGGIWVVVYFWVWIEVPSTRFYKRPGRYSERALFFPIPISNVLPQLWHVGRKSRTGGLVLVIGLAIVVLAYTWCTFSKSLEKNMLYLLWAF